MRALTKPRRRNRVTLKTQHITIEVYQTLRGYYVHSPQAQILAHKLNATSMTEASKLALKVVSGRFSWLARAWKKEINELTAETKRLTKELEQDAVTAKR